MFGSKLMRECKAIIANEQKLCKEEEAVLKAYQHFLKQVRQLAPEDFETIEHMFNYYLRKVREFYVLTREQEKALMEEASMFKSKEKGASRLKSTLNSYEIGIQKAVKEVIIAKERLKKFIENFAKEKKSKEIFRAMEFLFKKLNKLEGAELIALQAIHKEFEKLDNIISKLR